MLTFAVFPCAGPLQEQSAGGVLLLCPALPCKAGGLLSPSFRLDNSTCHPAAHVDFTQLSVLSSRHQNINYNAVKIN